MQDPAIMTRAVILAAGRGSRMGGSGDERPKCLMELGGRSLVERQVAALRRGGAGQVGVVRGYRAEMVDLPGLTYFSNPRWMDTNMVMSLAAAADWLRSGPVIVSYGDIFYRSDVVNRLIRAGESLAISYDRGWRSLWSRRFTDPLSDAETFRIDDAGNLTEIGGKADSIAEISGQYMGLLKFTPEAWSAIERMLEAMGAAARDRLDMTGLLRGVLAAKRLKIGTVATEGDWGEVDRATDVSLYETMIRAGELRLEDDPK
jgi:choline kinase